MRAYLERFTHFHYVGLAVGLLVLQGVALYLMGQPAICTCGEIKLWEGVVLSSGNSQHLSDWYTFSHIAHGLIFYYLLYRFTPSLPVGARLALAFGVEIAWELFENTDLIIGRYREAALAQGYTGDSILNSLSDTFFMALGFLVARKFPVWASVALILGVEVFAAYMVKDNLFFNIIQLIHPFDFINDWQSSP